MSTIARPELRSAPSRVPVDPADARALVDVFFDALGHFEGERPAIEDLLRVLAPDAEIVDGTEEDDRGAQRYARDAWLTHLEESSAQRKSALRGQFFEEVERTVTACATAHLRVASVVEERLTQGEAVERVDTLHCALLVGRVGTRAGIVHVTVRRSSRPPPG